MLHLLLTCFDQSCNRVQIFRPDPKQKIYILDMTEVPKCTKHAAKLH